MAIELSITAIGEDRPGVVAALTGALADLDVNLEDTSMTILGGRFAMVLIVAAPDSVDPATVEVALAPTAAALHLDVSVHRSAPSPPTTPGTRHGVSVYGADRPGIVHAISTVLADAGVNIADLTTRVVGAAESPVYAMLLDVTIPAEVDPDQVAASLRAAADDLGVECSMHPVDVDVL